MGFKIFLLNQRIKYGVEDRKALFIVDNFSGHNLTKIEKEEIETELNVVIKHLKPYTTVFCQPLDLNINAIVKRRMKEEWLKWFITENRTKAPCKQDIYTWFTCAWKTINPANIIKAFLMSGLSNDISGSEDILCLNLIKLKQKEQNTKIFPGGLQDVEELEKVQDKFEIDHYSYLRTLFKKSSLRKNYLLLLKRGMSQILIQFNKFSSNTDKDENKEFSPEVEILKEKP